MTLSTTHNLAPSLPPISMFTSRPQPPTSLMPASPPTSGYDKHSSLSILPKPFYKERPELLLSPPQNYYGKNKTVTTTDTYSPSSSSASSSSSSSNTVTNTPATPDQSTLWALFNQFQKEQENRSTQNRRGSEISLQERGLSSEEVLAEKRRRNAGASARFRDRRKQRERELLDKCNELEQRVKEVENALRRVDPEHALLLNKRPRVTDRSMSPTTTTTSTTSHHTEESDHTLFDRVGQLEHLMTRFRKEKETDVQKLDELEKENKYLKSLLVPVSLSPRKSDALDNNSHKRVRLSSASDIEN
ncbi:hypothetical protein BD770DRAFT_449563 [Pilaira anomala]|nr:hypothetical protein BD770DRAFT_449563 [Pilaira anomala]